MKDLDDIKTMDDEELVVLLGQLSVQLDKADERLAEINERVAEIRERVAEERATRLGLNACISAVRTELDRRYSNMLPIELPPLN